MMILVQCPFNHILNHQTKLPHHMKVAPLQDFRHFQFMLLIVMWMDSDGENVSPIYRTKKMQKQNKTKNLQLIYSALRP